MLLGNWEICNLSKTCLIHHVAEFAGVVFVVVHCPAVYAPVTRWPVPDTRRQLRIDFSPVCEHHLKPQLLPTDITDSIIGIHLNLPCSQRRYPHNLAIDNIRKLPFLNLLHHPIEHILRCQLFTNQVVLYRLELKFIGPEQVWVDF